MHKFIIEREIPGASKLSAEELREIALTSNKTVQELGVPYHWVQSFVAGDKIYCVHVAEDADTILEHARRAGFPANSITEVSAVIDPTTENL
jgi:hypothetical protein